MAIITNLDIEGRIGPGVVLRVQGVSLDEEVWEAVEKYLEANHKTQELSFNCNFQISSQGDCKILLARKNVLLPNSNNG